MFGVVKAVEVVEWLICVLCVLCVLCCVCVVCCVCCVLCVLCGVCCCSFVHSALTRVVRCLCHGPTRRFHSGFKTTHSGPILPPAS